MSGTGWTPGSRGARSAGGVGFASQTPTHRSSCPRWPRTSPSASAAAPRQGGGGGQGPRHARDLRAGRPRRPPRTPALGGRSTSPCPPSSSPTPTSLCSTSPPHARPAQRRRRQAGGPRPAPPGRPRHPPPRPARRLRPRPGLRRGAAGVRREPTPPSPSTASSWPARSSDELARAVHPRRSPLHRMRAGTVPSHFLAGAGSVLLDHRGRQRPRWPWHSSGTRWGLSWGRAAPGAPAWPWIVGFVAVFHTVVNGGGTRRSSSE